MWVSRKRGYKKMTEFNKEYFDNGLGSNYGGDSAEYTLENYLPQKRAVANKIISLIGIPKTVMCLGAGRGFQMIAFKYLGIDVSGVDISEYAVETSPEELKGKLVVGDISDNKYMATYPVGTYELVTGLDVLEHIPVPKLYNAILHSIRISSNYVMINIPIKNTDDEPDESATSTDATHVSIYSPSWWIAKYLQIGKPFNLELRRVEIHHDEETYQMFAIFQKHG